MVKTPPCQGTKGPVCCKIWPETQENLLPAFKLPVPEAAVPSPTLAWFLSSLAAAHFLLLPFMTSPLGALSRHSPHLLSLLCWLRHQPLNAGGPKALHRAFWPSLLILYSLWSLFNLPYFYFILLIFTFWSSLAACGILVPWPGNGACDPCLGSRES